MLTFVCLNCWRLHIVKKLDHLDVGQEHVIHCICEAVYRISIVELHKGKLIDENERRRQLSYTYDKDGNRVPLPDVSGQTAVTK